jgi:hypothetical protein
MSLSTAIELVPVPQPANLTGVAVTKKTDIRDAQTPVFTGLLPRPVTDHEQDGVSALDPANIVIAPPVKLCRWPANLAEYAKARVSKDLQWAESVPCP